MHPLMYILGATLFLLWCHSWQSSLKLKESESGVGVGVGVVPLGLLGVGVGVGLLGSLGVGVGVGVGFLKIEGVGVGVGVDQFPFDSATLIISQEEERTCPYTCVIISGGRGNRSLLV